MILTLILSSNITEKNWNAFRIANIAIKNGDTVNIFLIGEGVEYLQNSNDTFNIHKQVDTFLTSKQAQILACETCMLARQQKASTTCPVSGMKELYDLILTSDKVITF